MSDPLTPNAAPVQDITPAAPAPVVSVTPEATPAPIPDVAPVATVEAAPVTGPTDPTTIVPDGAKAVEPTPVAAEKKPDTLLGKPDAEAPKPVEPPVAAVTPEVTPPNDEGGQTEEPAPPPTYEPFVLPENVQLEPERLGKFTELLSKLELDGKADHVSVQKFGQEAVDFHIAEVTKAVENYHKMAVDTWEKQKTDWRDETIKDPELGGNRLQTTVDAARSFIRLYGGSQEQQEAIRNVMETSGLGNHPAVIRLFANATRELAEGKPLAGGRPVPAPRSKTQTLYGK